jgi:hypothetical protein
MATKQNLIIEGREVLVSNFDKVFYPSGRFTKTKVIDYYSRARLFYCGA